MTQGYLNTLDDRLARGAALLGGRFCDRRAAYVRSRQTPDGGFAGRRGGSDVYYTDFALRALRLLAPDRPAPEGAADYLRGLPHETRDLVECFNRLNCARMLGGPDAARLPDSAAIEKHLAGAAVHPYTAFLAALCYEMAGAQLPGLDRALAAVTARRCPDGGFGETTGQTNPTAAAVAFLKMNGALTGELGGAAADFLLSMQAPGGGFRPHASAPEPDLLSTFTALATLGDLGALALADLAGAGRLVKSLSAQDGGFRAGPSDGETDVEYTYYGAATAALLRAYVADPGAW